MLSISSTKLQDLLDAFPNVPRRSIQRDLKALVDKRVLSSDGETHTRIYRPAPLA